MNWTCTICSECCGSANFQNSTAKTHYPSAHQPSLAARPRTYPWDYVRPLGGVHFLKMFVLTLVFLVHLRIYVYML